MISKKTLATISLVIAMSATLVTPAFAADSDIYTMNGTSTPTLAYTKADAAKSLAIQNKIVLGSENYGYEYGGQVYKFDDVSTLFAKDGENLANTLSGLSAAGFTSVAVPVASATLAVSSVSAINATQAQVVFSQAVTGGIAQTGTSIAAATQVANDARNYSVGTLANHPSTAVLQADGKTVVLTFADATSLTGTSDAGTTNTLVDVEPIESATDTTVLSARYASTLTYKDTVAPTVTSITASTNTTVASSFTANFSEPIASLGSVKIDGTGVVGAFTDATHTAATFTTDLSSSVAHSVQFIGLADEAGNITPTFTQSFNVTLDASAPVATLAPSADKDYAFTLTFNKDVTPATVTAAIPTIVDENNSALTFGTATITQPDATNKKVYLVTSSNPSAIFGSKTTRTFSVALPSTIKDTLGNSLTAATESVTLTKDTTKPTITGEKVVKDASGNVTSIVLSSDSALSAATVAGLSIVDSNGVLVSTGSTATTVTTDALTTFGKQLGTLTESAVTAGDKTITLTPTAAISPATNALTGKYTFTFAAGTLSDEAATANSSAAVSQVVDFGTASTTASTFTIPSANVAASSATSTTTVSLNSALQSDVTKNVYKVNFGTPVVGGTATGSATDASKYTIDGNALPTGTTITLDATKSIATITIPTGTIATTDAAAVLYIAGVQDASGNTVVPVTTTVKINDNISPVISTVALNSDYSITVGTTEALKAGSTPAYYVAATTAPVAAATGDYAVYLDGVAQTGLTITAGNGTDAGKFVISGLTKAEYNAATSVTVKSLSTATITDVAGNVLTTGTTLTVK